MERFEYANPTTVKDATALLGASWNDAQLLAGGTDLISLMKDYVVSPKRVVNIKGIAELGKITPGAAGTQIGATVSLDDLTSNRAIRASYPSLVTAALGNHQPADPQHGNGRRRPVPAPRCWYFRQGYGSSR
jgi:xanthine dehydrogenase YagS FAD-binding subunit